MKTSSLLAVIVLLAVSASAVPQGIQQNNRFGGSGGRLGMKKVSRQNGDGGNNIVGIVP